MMRTCKTVLRIARKHYGRGNPSFYELAEKPELHPGDVISACKVLVEDGYMEYTYQIVNGKQTNAPAGVLLTLKGRRPQEYAFSQMRKYLKDNWIAILALVIAAISLIVSIYALKQP